MACSVPCCTAAVFNSWASCCPRLNTILVGASSKSEEGQHLMPATGLWDVCTLCWIDAALVIIGLGSLHLECLCEFTTIVKQRPSRKAPGWRRLSAEKGGAHCVVTATASRQESRHVQTSLCHASGTVTVWHTRMGRWACVGASRSPSVKGFHVVHSVGLLPVSATAAAAIVRSTFQ